MKSIKIASAICILLVSFSFSCTDQNKSYQTAIKPMTCYFFFIPDCPASRATLGPLMALKKKYEKNGLKVIGILSDPSPNDSILNQLLEENKVDFELIKDSSLAYAKSQGANTTPQFFLSDSLGNTLGKASNKMYLLFDSIILFTRCIVFWTSLAALMMT